MTEEYYQNEYNEYRKKIVQTPELADQILVTLDYVLHNKLYVSCSSFIQYMVMGNRSAENKRMMWEDITTYERDFMNFRYVHDRELKTKYWIVYDEFSGIWIRNAELDLEHLHIALLNHLKIDISDSLLYKLERRLRVQVTIDSLILNSNQDLITFKNGTLDLNTWEMREHSFEDYSTVLIPWNYRPELKFDEQTRKWIGGLAQSTMSKFPKMTMGDVLDLLLGYTGYILTKRNNLQHFRILYSKEGGSGKTTWINIEHALVGKKNASNVAMDVLLEKDFLMATLSGKLLNFYDDLNDKTIKKEGDLKRLITTLDIIFNPKYQAPRKEVYMCKHDYACNKIPFINNIDMAFARRPKILYFEQYIPAAKQDLDFAQKFIADSDKMETLLAECLFQYRDLLSRGNTEFGQPQEEMYHMWRMETDIIYQFVKKACEETKDSSKWLQQPVMYDLFVEYCEMVGNKPLDQRIFTEALGKMGYSKVQRRDHEGRRKWYYKHLKILDTISDGEFFFESYEPEPNDKQSKLF